MPGICGILDSRRTLNLAETLQDMLGAMRHEPWYRTDEFVDDQAPIALGRVSLGFVNTAQQPADIDGGRVIDERVAASRAAAQAARAGADALSAASVRNGSDAVDAEGAQARAQSYLRDAGMDGTVSVAGDTVTVTVTGESTNQILSVIGVSSFPIDETESARAITEEDSP